MKILLANPPWRQGNQYGIRAGSRWPHFHPVAQDQKYPNYAPFPFYLAYTAAILEENGFQVQALDCIADGINYEEFYSEFQKIQPDLLLMETSTPSLYNDLEIAAHLKKNCQPNLKIAIAGLHAELSQASFLQKYPQIDFSLFGEYEITALELAKSLISKSPSQKNILGLLARLADGEIQVNSRRPLISDLDSLPLPARHLFNMQRYLDAPCGLPTPSVMLWASRGCPYKCIFCAWPQIMYGGHSYRTRQPEKVVDELETVIQQYGFKSFYFDDDTFNIGKQRILKICQEIKNRRLNLPWAIMARADTMDTEMLDTLAQAGLYSLKYGIESGSQEILNKSGKHLDLEKAYQIIQETKHRNIKIHLTFAFGLPGETHESIKQTIQAATDLAPDFVQFSIIVPFPGCEYYDLADRNGYLLTKDWSRYNGSTYSVLRTEELSAQDLENARDEAYRIWFQERHKKDFKENFQTDLKKLLNHKIQKENLRILLIRSSYFEHAKRVLENLFELLKKPEIEILVQTNIIDQIKALKFPLQEFHIYDEEGFFQWRKFNPKLQEKLTKNPYHLALILYNDGLKESYREVEAILHKIQIKANGLHSLRLGVQTCGKILTV